MNYWQQLKNVYHFFQSYFWRAYFGWPDRNFRIYGVTGTNGKTTTCLFLAHILRAEHGAETVGLISTEVMWVGSSDVANETHMTTLDAKSIYALFAKMKQAGVKNVALEFTSHALDQHRLAGIKLDGAIVLNIRHEHLDYHRTMEEYARAKGKIVHYLKQRAPMVINGDDPLVKKTFEKRATIVYSKEQALAIRTELPGDINQENALAASLLAGAIGVKEKAVITGIADLRHVPGRMEWIELPNGARAIVDFALTPYAYDRLFKYLRTETSGQLLAVFGAAGRRDKTKRPIISRTVAKYADEIIITQDEPYDDPEAEIYQQIEEGLAETTIPWQRIEDREEAIRYALSKTQPGDVVAVPGMGNFNYRVVGDKKIPWNDKEVILKLSTELEKSK